MHATRAIRGHRPRGGEEMRFMLPLLSSIEADECYVVGVLEAEPERPDLAVEVVWTGGGLSKLEVYRGLGARLEFGSAARPKYEGP